jgi:hypothetical protein
MAQANNQETHFSKFLIVQLISERRQLSEQVMSRIRTNWPGFESQQIYIFYFCYKAKAALVST